MKSDIQDLLKNEWGDSIKNLESDKKKAESEKNENIKKAKDDKQMVLVIEKEHNKKMETLNH